MTTLAARPDLDVEGFLAAYPALAPLVEEAEQRLQPFFPGAPLVLEMFAEPEFGDPPKLHLVVVPTTDPQDAIIRYQQFLRDWWGAAAHQTQGRFAIVLEYRSRLLH